MVVNRRFPVLLIWVSGSTFAVLALLLALRWSAAATLPTPDEAAQEVRVFLKSEVNIRYLSELRAAGRTKPGPEVAARWDEELTMLDGAAIESPQVAIPLPSYLLGWPGYVVRVKIEGEVRYFSVRPEGSSERSAWLWWFSW